MLKRLKRMAVYGYNLPLIEKKIAELKTKNKGNIKMINSLVDVISEIEKNEGNYKGKEIDDLTKLKKDLSILELEVNKNLEIRNYLSFSRDVSNKKGKFPKLFA